MRQFVYYVAVTLDGFIAPPGGGDPSHSVMTPTPDLIDFIVTRYPETLPAPAREALGVSGAGRVFDTVVEGRSSYEVGLAAGVDDAYPHLHHLVFSTTLESVPGEQVELVADDALGRVRALKAEPGKDIWLIGGGRLAHGLLPEIDRLVIKLNPVVIGSGIPMFDGAFRPAGFTVTDTVSLASGVQVLSLDRRD